MSEHALFLQQSTVKAGDDGHRRKLLRTIAMYQDVVAAQKVRQFVDWDDARTHAGRVKRFVLENLPDLLETFEQRLSERGGKILWAVDALEAQKHLIAIARKHHVRSIVKGKSATTEEVNCEALFKSLNVEMCETDLGEFIVQLAGEKPSHIITPCMHKSKEEVSELFHRKLNVPLTDSIEELALAARAHLREKYLSADLGITGANFLIADEGAVVVVENEGNARLTMACPPVQVVIAGIEKVLPRLADLDLFLPLLAASGTGQQLTAYASIVRGPKQEAEADGPHALYVILLDNGRTRLFGEDLVRDSLCCIRCGACLNACPVYKTVGGHAYHTTYQGPIGAVITPHMRGMRDWKHLSFASTLCGACTEVCPVKIPLHEMLLMNRVYARMLGQTGLFWTIVLKLWAILFRSGSRVEHYRGLFSLGLNWMRGLLPENRRRLLPRPAKRSFNQVWNDHAKS